MARRKSPLFEVVTALLFAAGAVSAQTQAQTITIVSGNGQLVCPVCAAFAYDPLVVVVKDASGKPLAGASVTWIVTSGLGSVDSQLTVTKTTDSNGQSSVLFAQAAPLAGFAIPFNQSTVTAAIPAASVTFTETSPLALSPQGLPLPPSITLLSPTQDVTFTGQAGQQGTTPIQVLVTSQATAGVIPGVQLKITPTVPNGPTATCTAVSGQSVEPGTVLTDASGVGTCDLIFGGKVGSGTITVSVGSTIPVFTFNIQVTPGPPAMFRLLTGNNQSGNAGANLPAPLVAEVDDLGGNPLSDVSVVWDVSQGSATLFNTRSVSDAIGRVSTNVTLGSVGGPVQVRVRVADNLAVEAVFSATVNLAVTQFQKLSGDNQSAVVSTAFAQPLVVQVNNQGQPVTGVAVQFAVTSGSATLGTANPTTDAQGRASTTVRAGAAAGPVVITATVGGFTQTFSLTVVPPGPANLSFLNGAGFQANAISPCSVATITGTGLATGIQGVVTSTFSLGPLPLQVAGVVVQFGTVSAPIYSVANLSGQESVTVQVPCETVPGTVQVTIRVGATSATVSTQVLALSPGIFETTMSDGRRRAVLVRPDGTFVSLENPARRGETIRMFATGLGPVTPPAGTNQIAIATVDMNVVNPVVVGVNNAGVQVVSARYAPDLIGVYEVAFVVPSDAPAGTLPFAIALVQGNTLVFGNPSSIPVQ